MRRDWRRIFRPEVLFFLVVWLGLTARFQSRAFNDPGALWHIKVGEQILDRGFMSTDPFTYTFTGETWIPQQWGGEVAMALAHRLGGFDFLLHGFTVMMAVQFTWVFSRMVRNGLHPALAGVLTLGAVVVAAFHFYARPHLFTIFGMVVTMTAIVDFESGRASLWRLWWLIPFNILWTNIHGGVLGGVFTLGLAVAVWCLARVCHSKRPCQQHLVCRRTLLLMVGITATCVLTPFVNPFGLGMLHTWHKIVGSTAMKELVAEHQPLSLATTCGQVVVGFAVFYVFALLGTVPKCPRVSWLLPLVWFVLSLKGIRQGPLFTAIGVVALADFWPHTVWHRLLKQYGDSLAREPEVEPRGWQWAIIPSVLVVCSVALQWARLPVPIIGSGWAHLDEATIPVPLQNALLEYQRTKPADTRLFNDANLGGFVIFHAPGLPIFMDDRFELYGDPWMRDYAEVVYETPDVFATWATKHRFDAALVSVYPGEHRLPLEKWLTESTDWVEVQRCDCAVLFRKVRPAP